MNYLHQYHDSISTVQLSPFGEEQWNRIVTYSPIYVHWTDMLMMSQKRTSKSTSGKLNLIDQIDLNTLKLEDEILLNELYHIRRAAAIPSRVRRINYESKVLNDEQDRQTPSSTDDQQASSNVFRESEDPIKHHCSYVEPSVTPQQYYNIKRSVLTNQTISPNQVNGNNQVKQLPQFSLGPKPQPSLGVQLRQSAIAREHVLSATHDRHTPTSLSMSSSKRTASSVLSNNRQHQQQQYRTLQSSLSNEINPNSNVHEQLTRESSSTSTKRSRAKSTNSSRSTMHMLKTKNDRTRQKQNIQLKTLLVEPWKQTLHNDGILDETIPNSIEIMYRLCGPATPFERNLRRNFHRQLNQFRNSSMNS